MRCRVKLKDLNLYTSINNILNYTQDEKHLHYAAFMYASVYGAMLYGGITIEIT